MTVLKPAFLIMMTVLLTASANAEPRVSGRLPVPVREQLVTDMAFLSGLQGKAASPMFREIYGGVYNGSTLTGFFNARVKSIDSDECDGGPAMIACVIYSLNPHIIWLTDNYAKFNMPQIFRLSSLLHESRHSESAHRAHTQCPTPFRNEHGKDVVSIFSGVRLEGKMACDNSALSAYGTQVQFLKNTQLNCTNCNEKVKLDAELYGNDAMVRVINSSERQKLRKDLGK